MADELESKLYSLKKAFMDYADVVLPVPFVMKKLTDVEPTFKGVASVPDSEEIKVNDAVLSLGLLTDTFPFLCGIRQSAKVQGSGVVKDSYGFAVIDSDSVVKVSGVVYVPLDRVPFIHALKGEVNVIGLRFKAFGGMEHFLKLNLDGYAGDLQWGHVIEFVSSLLEKPAKYFRSPLTPVTYSGGGIIENYLDVASLMRDMRSKPVALNVLNSLIITVPVGDGATWVDKFIELL